MGIANTVVIIITAILGITLGRLFGLIGIGATIIGWFAYNYSRKKFGIFVGIIVGIISGLAAYGLATVALISLTS